MTIRPIRKDLGDLRDVMVSATEPTVRNDGDALQTNDVWLDLGNDVWKLYDGAAFQTIGGGGGSVAVDDDGTEVVAAASGLNFGTGLSVTDDGGGDVTIDLSATGDGAYAETIGDGAATSFAVTHNLGTEDVHVQVWDVSGADPVLANGDPSSVTATDTNTVTVAFGSAPTTDQYRVVVLASGSSGGGGGTTWLDPVASGNGPGGSNDDEFDDSSFDTGVWTVVDPASPTIAGAITEDADVLSVLHPGGDAAAEWHGIMQSLGGLSAPVTIETAVRWMGREQNYAMVGIGFAEGTTHGTDDALVAGIFQGQNTSDLNWNHRRWDGYNSYVSADEQFSLAAHKSTYPWIHIRHTWVSANTWRAEYSPDGVSWINPAGADHSVTLTPTHMGLFVSTYGGSLPQIFTFEYFRVS